jgi:NAD(P)-dependent dehydrogenase (short-subunit alcohol dehydrogenase family)
MDQLLAGKVAVVTGAASGIGRAVALAFAEHGANAVVVADLQDSPREGGLPTHHHIQERTSAESHFVTCDVGSVDQLDAVIEVAEDLGGVDVMVNNAGIYAEQDFLEASEAEFERMMSVNVKGVYFGAQAAARSMSTRGTGTIINVGSGSAVIGSSGFAAYCATKGAVRAMTFALAAELGPRGIRVSVIEPWHIETMQINHDVAVTRDEQGRSIEVQKAIPLRRTGYPQDVANAAVYLASDLASYVTGSELFVDGGRLNTDPDASGD